MTMDPRETVDEDNLFRASILECMFKSLGLDTNGSVSREPESMEGSPRGGPTIRSSSVNGADICPVHCNANDL